VRHISGLLKLYRAEDKKAGIVPVDPSNSKGVAGFAPKVPW
jgi:hypothetical protein